MAKNLDISDNTMQLVVRDFVSTMFGIDPDAPETDPEVIDGIEIHYNFHFVEDGKEADCILKLVMSSMASEQRASREDLEAMLLRWCGFIERETGTKTRPATSEEIRQLHRQQRQAIEEIGEITKALAKAKEKGNFIFAPSEGDLAN